MNASCNLDSPCGPSRRSLSRSHSTTVLLDTAVSRAPPTCSDVHGPSGASRSRALGSRHRGWSGFHSRENKRAWLMQEAIGSRRTGRDVFTSDPVPSLCLSLSPLRAAPTDLHPERFPSSPSSLSRSLSLSVLLGWDFFWITRNAIFLLQK